MKESKRGPGQPPFVPTPEQRLMVQILASNGTPQDVIARNIRRAKGDTKGISEPTLRKAFREELDCGYADTLARMGATVVREGLKGQGWAAKLWLQTHGGETWKAEQNVRYGLTPDTQAALGNGSLVAPVLVIQPVKSVDIAQKANGHTHPALEADQDEASH